MFTDGGETVNALKMDSSFCNERKQQKINTILQQNHVYLAEDEFVLSVAADKFVMGMHEFLQCMIEISNITSSNDLYIKDGECPKVYNEKTHTWESATVTVRAVSEKASSEWSDSVNISCDSLHSR